MICENCSNEHDGSYGSGRFCTVKCSKGFATKGKREEINKKVSLKLKHSRKKCESCGTVFPDNRIRKSGLCIKCRLVSDEHKELLNSIARVGGLKSASVIVKRSKNEILFYDMCNEYFNDVKHNKPIFNGWDADIIIEDIKTAVLWNGKWHYEKIMEGHSLEQVQNRDKIKLKEIKKCSYKAYIIKDMGKYNPIFVKEQFDKFICSIN